MPVQVCSLIVSTAQPIPAGGEYHLLRFPFGTAESYDAANMHAARQPDGHVVRDWKTDDRSGLIWPSVDGWGSLTAMIFWEQGGYTEVRDRFVRDPLGLNGVPDSTATVDHPRTPGAQFLGKHHEIFVHPGVPLGLLVRHNATGTVSVTFAEFKLAIHT